VGYYGRGDYYRGDNYSRGDPGLLGSLFKGVVGAVKGFVTGGPIGAVVGAGKALIPTRMQIPAIAPPVLMQQPQIGGQIQSGGLFGGVQVQQFGPPIGGAGGQQPVGTMTSQGFIPGLCGMKGTRPNKSSYFKQIPGTMQGQLIPKGSVCVKTRRLNVANPRALRRAIRRMAGFAKLARRSIRWVTAKPPKGRPVAKKR